MNINKQSPAFKGAFSIRMPYIGNNKNRVKAITKLTYRIFDDAGARVIITKVDDSRKEYTTGKMSFARIISAIIPDQNDGFVLSRLIKTIANKKKLNNQAAVVNYTSSVGNNFTDNKIAGEVLSLLW